MNNQIVYNLFYQFSERGFSVLRFNFRGVGRSQGEFDHGSGELSDAAAALDWLQTINPDAKNCWIAGVSFGSWIGMQLLMRRPEVRASSPSPPLRTASTSPSLRPARHRASSFMGPRIASRRPKEVMSVIEKVKTQRASRSSMSRSMARTISSRKPRR